MKPEPKSHHKPPFKIALKIVCIYGIFSLGWITFSDQILLILFQDPEPLTKLQMYKGTAFILVTSLILFLFIYRETARYQDMRRHLAEQEIRMSLAMKATQTGIWTSSVKTNKITWSDENFRIFGYEPGDIEPSFDTWQKCVHPDDLELVNSHVINSIEKKTGFDLEYRIVHPDGTIHWVKDKAMMIFDDHSEPEELYGIKIDITEHVRLEEDKKQISRQLQQSQKMEAIGALSGGIAHDFNNILMPIMGYTELACEQLLKDHPAYSYLKEIKKAAIRARDLVSQILTFSRQSDDKIIPVNMYLIIKEVLKLLRVTIPANIIIQESIEYQEGYVLADPTQIHQIIMNLCTNAWHSMKVRGGTLKVVLSETHITHTSKESPTPNLPPGDYISLEVSDTGCGMNDETMKKIFKPYFSTKKKDEGTGLGLSVVHEIVDGMKGSISVSSKPSQGTTFNLHIPKAKRQSSDLNIEDTGPLPRGTEKILLVDDSPTIVRMEQMLLENLDYEVTPITNSTEALDVFNENPEAFDIVITDMNMPEMTGMNLAENIIRQNSKIPIILCTGFSELLNEEKAKLMGIRGFLMKPVLKKKLALTIRKVLDETTG